MRLANIKMNELIMGLVITDNYAVLISDILDTNKTIENLLVNDVNKIREFIKNENSENKMVALDNIEYAPIIKSPNKILGIGLNYQEHASDLESVSPSEFPVVFMKPDNVIIGHGDIVKIPKLSNKTTGEAELGIIISKEAKNIKIDNWLDYVLGFTPILDMTAEDILMKNTRYLGISKSFDTFLSIGPELITPDEISDLDSLNVSTVLNNVIIAKNSIGNMMFSPAYIISFLSKIMTLKPGDIISTGTPRAVHIHDGDIIECRIDGFKSLVNSVIDLKK